MKPDVQIVRVSNGKVIPLGRVTSLTFKLGYLSIALKNLAEGVTPLWRGEELRDSVFFSCEGQVTFDGEYLLKIGDDFLLRVVEILTIDQPDQSESRCSAIVCVQPGRLKELPD